MSLNALAEACEDKSIKSNVLSSESVGEKASGAARWSNQISKESVREKDSSTVCWSNQISKEERQFITDKIRTAYQRKTPSYDELLDICCAIEEEHVFLIAPSKLDYFKSGVQYEKRIVETITSRRRCLSNKSAEEVNQTDDSIKNVKRAKIQH